MPARTSIPTLDPAPLLERAASGDQDAWADLVHAYTPRLYALAKSRLRDHHSAEEIVQSVLVTVATHLSQGKYDHRGLFEPWLFRIAMNRIRDEGRRRTNHASPMDPGEMPPTPIEDEHNDDPTERFGPLRNALGTLSDDDRQIIELRHHAELPFKTIAEMLGTPIGTLLARHHRALKKLKDALEPSAIDRGANA